MDDLTDFPHHIALEEISEVLCVKTGRDARPFFRTLAIYYMSVMASCMRARVNSPVYGELPVNSYVIALAGSGFGKGKSTGAMEDTIMCDFRNTFRDYVLQDQAEKNMNTLASRFAALRGGEEDKEYEKLAKEFATCGEYPFTFDGGSESAIKQVRQMLLLANCGSLNLQIDEIGTNLEKIGTVEAMGAYLELYDKGKIKNKLLKNTADNKRGKELEGMTPANMLLFGTPDNLLDASALEKKFMLMLATGYARRCLFAWAEIPRASGTDKITVDDIYARRTNPVNEAMTQKWCQHFASLADPAKLNWTVDVPEAVDKLIIAYELECLERAGKLGEFDAIRRAEMEHRYFRVLKIAGTLAFVEEALDMSEDHVKAAIKVVEESGAGFQSMLNREPAEAKLARFIASTGREMTHPELIQELPFYKAANKADRSDLLTLATAWGYKHHIVIKKSYVDGIELFAGEALKETNLEDLSLSWSKELSHGYDYVSVPFGDLPELTQAQGLHWANHAFLDQHRCEDKTIPGFDMLVFDVDGDVPLQTAHDLLEDYVFMTYTTKRHTPDNHRYRLILPMNYQLKLDAEDYRQFYRNVMTWLPFQVDESTVDRCRKWMTNDAGTYHQNADGKLFDVLPFVPKTQKNEERQKEIKELGSLDNLERWFAQRIAEGNRNNNMIKFALALVDSGMDYNTVQQKVLSFNAKLSNGLSSDELQRTVLVTAAKRLQDAE